MLPDRPSTPVCFKYKVHHFNAKPIIFNTKDRPSTPVQRYEQAELFSTKMTFILQFESPYIAFILQ